MKKFINDLRNKSIHLVGVTGAEGSSILRFLVKHNISNISTHDFLKEGTIAKSFRLWHKGLSTKEREELYQQFQSDLTHTKQNLGPDYLKGIGSADIVFVPQSWRLYKKENSPLWKISGKVPFYSLTRIYLDLAPARIIGVTGTAGKGSTTNIIFQLLKKSLPAGRRVYFAGNETWMPQLADKLDEMTSRDFLVLEVSHRQLIDGWSKAPHIVIFTNLYPNHLDEVSWKKYQNLKLSLIRAQSHSDFAVLNYDVPVLRQEAKNIKAKVVFFSEKYERMNTKGTQRFYDFILNTKTIHYPINLLAASSIIDILGLDPGLIKHYFPKITSLPARLEYIGMFSGVKFYNDIKSTTPWSTLAALRKVGKRIILICGGKTKGIDYKDFFTKIKQYVKFVIVLQSELSNLAKRALPIGFFTILENLDQAIKLAYKTASEKETILISPAAGFFYSDFIKGKKSIKKITTSLPPKGQVVKD